MIPIYLGRILSIVRHSPFSRCYPENRLTRPPGLARQGSSVKATALPKLPRHQLLSLEHVMSKSHKTQVATSICLYLQPGKGRTKNRCSKSYVHSERFILLWHLPGDLPVRRDKPTTSILACITHEVKRLQTPPHPQTPSQRIRYWWEDSSVLRRTYQRN